MKQQILKRNNKESCIKVLTFHSVVASQTTSVAARFSQKGNVNVFLFLP